MIAHKDALAQHCDVVERTLWMATDNRAALSWSTKGSSTSTSARAFLLRYNALHQRTHRYVALHDHIAGTANLMADDASRRWDLTDDDLLTHFNFVYPQALPWQMLPLHSSTNSALIGALFKKRRGPASQLVAPPPLPARGISGLPSAAPSASTPTICRQTPSPFSKSSPSASALVHSHPADGASSLGPWRTPSAVWARRMPHWGPWTLD